MKLSTGDLYKNIKNNISVLIVYVAFILRAFSFILIMPRLTHVIEPSVWGAVLSAQALAMWLILIIDFSFSLSVSRKLAILKDNALEVRRIVGNVYSAKILLIIPAAIITLFSTRFGILQKHEALAWWSLAWACAQGFSPLWYYQSIEKMYRFSSVEIIGRILYIVLCLLLIHSTHDAYLVIAIQAIVLAFVNLITLLWLAVETKGFSLSIEGALAALMEGLVLSGFSLLTSVYTTASVFLFGIFALPINVALYGNADRLTRSAISLLSPLNQILLPRSARAFAFSRQEGFATARKFFIVYLFIGISAFIGGYYLAPLIVNTLFGKNYYKSIVYLRALLILVPLTSANTVIVYHILIPNNMENKVTKLYTYISIFALILIIVLVPYYQTSGMIVAMTIPEILALIFLVRQSILLYQSKII